MFCMQCVAVRCSVLQCVAEGYEPYMSVLAVTFRVQHHLTTQHKHTYTYTHAHMQTHAHAHTQTHTHTRTRTHTHTRTNTHTTIHTRTHAHVHAYAHAHAHAHAHINGRATYEFSKVSSPLYTVCQMTIDLTFENFHLTRQQSHFMLIRYIYS